ncbi:LacI family DNA-binding transcriptional regulator [Enterococcus italicus]|uniref:LacI family DNA-binding transcriptional regulator n=1 Tax=Enterococcus italicus TaxID=246144 RepID=UPI002073BD45|nr:LacI family DNA-binding transcriptional regulator [Enterococcus italicus]
MKLTDVAQRAGVSPTTVSRVINNYGSLSQKTIDKVHAAMKELNYQPNAAARSLQGKNTQLIGLLFPSVAHPFFGELVDLLETKLFARGYKTLLCDCASNSEKERSYLQMLAANKVDGIIAGAHNLGIQEYEQIHLPIISFDRQLATSIPIVGSDNFQGGYLATQALHQKGARKIAIITGSLASSSPTNNRLQGYRSFLSEHQLDEQLFSFASFEHSYVLKKRKVKQILSEQSFDGLFCTDDLTAILVWNCCQELGISLPDDLKLIGYDGTTFIQNFFPQLATIKQPLEEISTLLIDLLLCRIASPTKELEALYELPCTVINGQSL